MKIFNKVKGTMKIVSAIDVNVDTIYIRSNVKKVEEDTFKGWEYDEMQYTKDEYIAKLSNIKDTQSMAILISMLCSEIDCMKKKLDRLEVK